jgi:hypothetical protein
MKLFGRGPSMRLDRDSEGWGLDARAVEHLLASLAQRTDVAGGRRAFVLLGGDVHFGYSARLQYWARRPFEAEPVPVNTAQDRINIVVAQLVASSFKNQAGITKWLHKIGYYPIVDALPPRLERLGWNNPGGDTKQIGTVSVLGLPLAWNTQAGDPALTYDSDSYFHETLNADANPDWRYRADYLLADFEINADDVDAANPEPLGNDRRQALRSYLKAADDYDDYTEKWGHGKEIVGLNNFGEITFEWEPPAARKVIHTLWWRMEERLDNDQLLKPAALSRFVVPMDFDDSRYPQPPFD